MLKRMLMLALLGSAFLFGSACFVYGSKDASQTSSVEACKGLSGKARTDCEARNGG